MRPSTLNSNLDDRNTPINGEGGYTLIVSDSGLIAIIPQVMPPTPELTKFWDFPNTHRNGINNNLMDAFDRICGET